MSGSGPGEDILVYDTVPEELVGRREMVDVTVTSLEMFADPRREVPPAPDGVRVVRAHPPGVRFYRFLYDAVGRPWQWHDRKLWDDAKLAATVDDPRVEVHVLWRRGTPAGYVELDRRGDALCEVAYFGLMPEAIGGGLGAYLLTWAVREAWRDPALKRLWVHTCTLDHPKALGLYERCGFVRFRASKHRQYIVIPEEISPDHNR
jgi:GNAT superfamily N-acetyltransferase